MGMFRTAVGGAAWTTLSTIVRSIVSLIQVSILTRFLEKSDFGIVAIATLFIGFTSIFLDLGISIGILHKQDVSKDEYSSLFWLNIIVGASLTSALVLLAPLISYFYKEDQLTIIIELLCLNLLFASIGNQHRIVQQKNMQFRTISIVEITASISTLFLVIFLAKNGYGVFSLVYSSLFGTLFPNVLFLIIGILENHRIRFHFNLKETHSFLKIGGFNVAGEVIDYFSREIDIIIISATLGKEALGLYSLCKKLAVSLFSMITPIYNKVLVPLLAKIQHDVELTRNVIYDIVESSSLINFPLFTVIAIFSGCIIHFIYGNSYMDGAIILSILSLNYGYICPSNMTSCVQIAFGRTDVGLYWTFIRVLIWMTSSYIGALFSIEGLAFAILLGSLLSSPLFWVVTIKPIIGGRFIDYYKRFIYPFFMAVIIAIPFYLLLNSCTRLDYCICAGIVYFSVYFFLTLVFFRNTYIFKKVGFLFNYWRDM